MMATPPAHEHGSCVLIVDDDEDERDSLRDVVEMLGLSALMAANAEDALAILEHSLPCQPVDVNALCGWMKQSCRCQ